jgi:hypothetical protein
MPSRVAYAVSLVQWGLDYSGAYIIDTPDRLGHCGVGQ